LKVGLFAGQGWAKAMKRDAKAWSGGEELSETFNIDLTRRDSILCGLVFQEE